LNKIRINWKKEFTKTLDNQIFLEIKFWQINNSIINYHIIIMRVLVHGIKKYATFQSFRKYRDIDELYLPNPANLKDVIALIK
jgi:hypothetical protein